MEVILNQKYELVSRLESIIERWNQEAEKLEEQLKRLEAVRDMISKDVLEPEIIWRSIQRDTWRRCALHLKSKIDYYLNTLDKAEYEKARMVRELKSQGRESEIGQAGE